MEKELKAAALEYSERFNYPIIPVNPVDKKPFVKWLEFQNRKATDVEIKLWWTKWPNAMIGAVTGKISGDFVIDVDNPLGNEALLDYIPESIITPTSLTPRGGKHLHFEHPEEDITIKAGILPHVDYRGNNGYIVMPPSINSEGRKYKWLPGLSIESCKRASLPAPFLVYIKEFVFNKETKKPKTELTSTDFKFFEYGRRDEDLFHVANTMTKGGAETSIIANVLERIILSWGENPDRRWIDAKIKSAFDRSERKNRNISQEVRQWVLTSTGFFLTSTGFNELQLTSRSEKKAMILELLRLKEQGIIESYGEKRGCYRLVESSSDEIDFIGVEEKVLDLIWPFEIEKWVKILPKNIIVISGESNSGKTAFMLNVCFMNMGRFKINYFSSEMGAMELRDRLKKFEVNLTHWKEHINFRERSSNFADVIKPNEVNIVDFLEITDEFYKIGGMIKEIYDKLKKGIAIIALQKNPNTDFGLGGMRSVEKARLYCAMESGRIKIVKGKNWANPEWNPNGIWREFKLVAGAKFIAQGDWKRG